MQQEERKGVRMTTEEETERKEKLLMVGSRRGWREESSGLTPGEFEDAGDQQEQEGEEG